MDRGPVRVLFVEDNDDHAELVIRSLQEHNVANRIVRVCDGEQALDYLMRRGAFADRTTSPRPDVILLDLRLPRMDGLEVLAAIKSVEGLRAIPVVVLTTSESESDIARAQSRHANAYVVKPLAFDKFVLLMRDLGYFWLAWNQPPALAHDD
ncbi:MAG: response regulator [Sandaracinaceae bacterium]|nr:response regulator [Sandaracinaceae bacterium]